MFRWRQSLRSMVHGPNGPELLDVGRRIRMIGVLWVRVRHGVVVKRPPQSRGGLGSTGSRAGSW
jgi:hypothetical protein